MTEPKKPTPPPNREYRQDESMDDARPVPDREEIRLYNDEGELAGCPVERGEIERPNIQPE